MKKALKYETGDQLHVSEWVFCSVINRKKQQVLANVVTEVEDMRRGR